MADDLAPDRCKRFTGSRITDGLHTSNEVLRAGDRAGSIVAAAEGLLTINGRVPGVRSSSVWIASWVDHGSQHLARWLSIVQRYISIRAARRGGAVRAAGKNWRP